MLLINLQVLNAIPDQDTYYDVADYLEEQGMAQVIQHHMNKKGADLDLLEQFQIYEAVLKNEDGMEDSPYINQIENIRKVPRIKSEEETRKSRRHSTGNIHHPVRKTLGTTKLSTTKEEPKKLVTFYSIYDTRKA